jgi:hypothetical protein
MFALLLSGEELVILPLIVMDVDDATEADTTELVRSGSVISLMVVK